MRVEIFIFLGVALVVVGISLSQFAWWLEWHYGFEYAHEIGCILLYTGIALLLAVLAVALISVARVLERMGQIMVMKAMG